MYCTHCGKELLDTDLVCPACGQPVEGRNARGNVKGKIAKNKKWIILFGGIGLAVVAALFVIFKTPLLLNKDEKQTLEFVEHMRQDFDNAKIQVQTAKLYYGKEGDLYENSDTPDDDMAIAEIWLITDGTFSDKFEDKEICDDGNSFMDGRINKRFLFTVACIMKCGDEYTVYYDPKEEDSSKPEKEQLGLLIYQLQFGHCYTFCEEYANELPADSIARITRVTGQLADPVE